MDILKGKRYDIMNVLWEEGRPLSAFEINEIAPELKMPTVRRCLELLLKENLIKVAGTSMNGKVYARNYTPLITREEYLKGNAQSRKNFSGGNDACAFGNRRTYRRGSGKTSGAVGSKKSRAEIRSGRKLF